MAKFKVGDKVTDGNSVYVITGIDGEYGDYLWRRVSGVADASHSQGGTKSWVEGNFRLANSVRSTNSVVANALAVRTARNGNIEDKVRVTMDCFDFSGLRKVTKVMTLAALKQLLAQTKAPGATYDRVAYDIEKNGGTEIVIDPKITIVAEWASRA